MNRTLIVDFGNDPALSEELLGCISLDGFFCLKIDELNEGRYIWLMR